MEMPAVIRRRTRLSPEARREQLMQCAIEVFSKRGLGRAGHAEIAELAQVSVATVFNYFSSREQLVDSVLIQIEDFFSNMVRKSFIDLAGQPSKSAHQAIHDYLADFVEAAINNPQFTYIWLEWSSSIREDTWPRYLALLDNNIAIISNKIEPAIASGEINTYLTTTEFARSLSNQGYMILQLVNQPQAMDKESIIEFLEKYVTSALAKA
ncbi:SmcR-like protein VvpR [Moritella viscosa]|uniref:SmcR-like protein VvpR n=2 Tax=Moritella viscosa TaxID=80854 RepID=A0A1L0AYJ0_9GAMM|nr:TetR/AcrR family transcriptional regulator [Moritella viscosa]SGY94241.1 SmcR-like protein VvpR [Moritella viscosa]SGY98870.1 SmcR-like protein VvpR [Moritella viscosa]SHO05544.1 SmcR-like protein VvpR [Moritella viscosa]SHO05546.1 SmcR-like protein VvpR [Moritella viscosa]SHO06422.1 SmcR-like protein VvpR [Moritella viscosa]